MVITFMLKRHIVIDKDYREKMISHMLLYYRQIRRHFEIRNQICMNPYLIMT